MKAYGIAKYNKDAKKWELTKYYRTFRDALEDITFERVIAVYQNGKVYTKEKVPFELMYQWTKVLMTKDLTKKYITKNKDMYLIKEIEIIC